MSSTHPTLQSGSLSTPPAPHSARYSALYTAFAGERRIAGGELAEVACAAQRAINGGDPAPVHIFADLDSRLVEIDMRGSADDLRRALAARPELAAADVAGTVPLDAATDSRVSANGAGSTGRGPGRPRLGVVAREVTLLPRHWEWLASQPGGASVALRKLVDEGRRANPARERVRLAQEAANRFMTTMGGDRPGFEEGTRALFAGDAERFRAALDLWPSDIARHACQLADAAFAAADPAPGLLGER